MIQDIEIHCNHSITIKGTENMISEYNNKTQQLHSLNFLLYCFSGTQVMKLPHTP